MHTVKVTLPSIKSKYYPILIGKNILKSIDAWLCKSNKIVIITDHTVNKFYAAPLLKQLRKKLDNVYLISCPAGEKNKNAKTKQYIEEQMLRLHCGRDTLILAVGGGVIGDIAGFVAATYMRGIPYIQIPTTLLAMVDSSVGGKTAINTQQGKNLIGVFWQPVCVMADTHCLTTLPEKQVINGLVEAIKIFLTCDKSAFTFCNKHLDDLIKCDQQYLIKIIKQAVKLKAEIVSQDETEQHKRMILNFGHTIGHAIEKVSQYKILHGYAVALGILVETKIAELLGYIKPQEYQAIEGVIQRLKIRGKMLKKFDMHAILNATQHDKKVRDNKVNYVILKKIGQVDVNKKTYTQSVPAQIVKQALFAVAGV